MDKTQVQADLDGILLGSSVGGLKSIASHQEYIKPKHRRVLEIVYNLIHTVHKQVVYNDPETEPRSHFDCKCGDDNCRNHGWVNWEDDCAYIHSDVSGSLIYLDVEEVDALIERLVWVRAQMKEKTHD